MFACLALAGDLGATVSPSMVGGLSNLAGGNLKTGLLVATVFPAVLTCELLFLKKRVTHNFPQIGSRSQVKWAQPATETRYIPPLSGVSAAGGSFEGVLSPVSGGTDGNPSDHRPRGTGDLFTIFSFFFWRGMIY